MDTADDKIKKGPLFKGDIYIWIAVLFLCSISLVEVFSASSRLTFGKSSYLTPILSHVIHLSMGIIVMYVLHLIHYRWYKLFPVLLVPVSLILLAYLSFVSKQSAGAERWVDLGFFKLQPSELGKVAAVMTVAALLAKLKPDDEQSQSNIFMKILIVTGAFCLLIFTENLSTAILLGAVVYIMMILGGISWRRMLGLTGVVFAIGLTAVLVFVLVPPKTLSDSRFIPERALTWQARILDFTNSGSESNESAYEYARNTAPEKPQETHANIAIASSHFLGKGPGNSYERDYLQEASCDFIYAIIIEELGMVGAVFVLVVYVVLLFRIGKLAMRCTDKYPAYLAMGLGMMLGLQAFINMSVAVGLFPVTGQPLPLISKGGTSVLMASFSIGMLIGISNTLDKEAAMESMDSDSVTVEETGGENDENMERDVM
ncbi:MAG: FtsW/RodA/SpoVE family cell cycle protein [Bacteroidaceae bacterium]|nr:FtsW/RodA/SpoVE family cell cycle protein [Bacteroidaceae bacterium]